MEEEEEEEERGGEEEKEEEKVSPHVHIQTCTPSHTHADMKKSAYQALHTVGCVCLLPGVSLHRRLEAEMTRH